MTARETGDGIEAALAAHPPTCSGRARDGCGPLYCPPCSDAANDWVEWTPAHVAAALRASAPEDGLRAAVEALADEWGAKYADHISAGIAADSELVAALQVASGSVRKLCADELRALLADQPPTPDEGVSP